MAKKFREKLRKLNPFTRPATLEELSLIHISEPTRP